MTENQWPQTPNPAVTDPYGAATVEDDFTTPSTSGPAGDSKTDAAKAEASDVAGQATSAAKDVAHTAKEEAANVAAEAKTNAKDLMNQAKTGLSSEAGAQQQKAAEGIRNISGQLHSMASAPEQQGMTSDLIRQAAERGDSVASWLENREPGDLLGEVQRFARNKPGTFLLLAAGAGLLAGRLTRSLTAGAPEQASGTAGAGQAQSPAATQQAAHSAPVQPLHQETVYAAGTDDLFAEPTVTGTPSATSTLPGGTAEDTPLRYEDDPFGDEDGSYRTAEGGFRSTEGRP
ncbi:hypothetical protein SAMN04489743_0350 [Pseudarthrobacter equi]|uniref:Uncharacterized protein n=1 Tax=Pseudarthrobacter equi TaxID=728066 RepID=A0A1H1T951_9MICC|nr:hypothetical protein [Pseudarthrobacter equi]SDS56757.1 hypothetical protein SAMN04489743_0350 [Pseudarthrobacter equi]